MKYQGQREDSPNDEKGQEPAQQETSSPCPPHDDHGDESGDGAPGSAASGDVACGAGTQPRRLQQHDRVEDHLDSVTPGESDLNSVTREGGGGLYSATPGGGDLNSVKAGEGDLISVPSGEKDVKSVTGG